MTPWLEPPRPGLSGRFDFVVGLEHVIDFATDGMPQVLSTPKLVGLIERTARETLKPLLPAGFRTVGSEVSIRHLAPTPAGASVTIEVKITGVSDDRVQFVFEVRDSTETIARGAHVRTAVDIARFSRRVGRKSPH